MALLFIDGFDTYRSSAQMNQSGWWRNTNISSSSESERYHVTAAGRFAGNCVVLDSSDLTIPVPATPIYLGFAAKFIATQDLTITFRDAAYVSTCRMDFSVTSGSVTLRTYNYQGFDYVVATSNAGLFNAGAWNFWEISVSNSATVGSITVRLNGVTVVTIGNLNLSQYSQQLNTGTISFGCTNGFYIDDLYLCNGTTGAGTYPNNTFLGDKRVNTLYPLANNAVQFTPKADSYYSFLEAWNLSMTVSGTVTLPANTVVVAQQAWEQINGAQNQSYANWYAPQTLSLTSVDLQVAVLTPSIHIKCVIYTVDPDAAGRPKTLLATSNEVTALAVGMNRFTFGTPVTLTKGVQYFFGWFADASVSLNTVDNAYYYLNQNNTIFLPFFNSTTQTYGSPPTTFPWATGTPDPFGQTNYINFVYNYTCDNCGEIGEQYCDNANTYNYSNTVGQQDSFTTDGTLSTNSIVYGVQVTGVFTKNDAGARAACNLIISGGTQSNGATTSLGTSYAGVTDIYAVDPNTSASWTPANVNAAKIGYKLVS